MQTSIMYRIDKDRDKNIVAVYDRTTQSRARRMPSAWLRLVLVVLFWLMIWEVVYRLIGRDLVFSSPLQVLERLASLARTRMFWQSTLQSLLRIGWGFLLGLASGILLAIASATSKWFDALFRPLLSMIRATPVSSFIILALIWMSNVRVVVFIVFLMVMPIVWANLHEGIIRTDRQLLEMTHLFRIGRVKTIRWIYLPSLTPYLISAATTGLGLGWKAGIAAEVLSTPPLSLGKSLYESKIYLETQDLFAYTAVVILLSMLLEKVVIRGFVALQDWMNRHDRLLGHHSRKLLGRSSLTRRDRSQDHLS